MTDQEVIDEMTHWIVNFLEKPHPALANLPVCPFVKQARIKNKIQFEVYNFGDDIDPHLSKLLRDFAQQKQYDVLWIINPDKTCPAKRSYSLEGGLYPLLSELNLMAFGGGPDDTFTFKGIKTRQEPYANLVIQSRKGLTEARAMLVDNTAYYE